MPRDGEPLSQATVKHAVGPRDLASAVALEPGERFPAVLSTSRMIALMEVAASRTLRPLLLPGELSVGVLVDIVHSAATPAGEVVTATAYFVGRDEKSYVFEVVAEDAGGVVGRGTHKRAIVATDRLVAGAQRRVRKDLPPEAKPRPHSPAR